MVDWARLLPTAFRLAPCENRFDTNPAKVIFTDWSMYRPGEFPQATWSHLEATVCVRPPPPSLAVDGATAADVHVLKQVRAATVRAAVDPSASQRDEVLPNLTLTVVRWADSVVRPSRDVTPCQQRSATFDPQVRAIANDEWA